MQVVKPKEKPKIESIGKGEKLGDIARVNHAIGRLKAPLLKPLHKILYDRPGAVSTFICEINICIESVVPKYYTNTSISPIFMYILPVFLKKWFDR